jgi:hypothetical protein
MSSTHYHHLAACAEDYARRAAHPMTAWDQLSAKTWSALCETLANELVHLSEADALAHLIRRRDEHSHLNWNTENSSPWAFLVTIDLKRQMDIIVDPIAREHRGWIEVSTFGGLDDGKMSVRPGYRRMLGVNHCVSHCGRQPGESDEAWQSRRVNWLGRYHPDIHVTSRDNGYGWGVGGGQCTSLLGTVREFAAITHPWVNKGTCVACSLPTATRQTRPDVASYSTECGPMCGICHREREPHRHPAPESSEAFA